MSEGPSHYAALLDRCGRIIVLRLDRSEQGAGLVARALSVQPVRKLAPQADPRSFALGCVRFFREGETLWLAAIDLTGTVIRVRFDAEKEG